MIWIAIRALDVATEIPLMLLPAYLVLQLLMKITTKLHIIVAFWFRLMSVLTYRIPYLSELDLTYITALLSSRFYNSMSSGDTIPSPRRLLD
jgi:hypothetical protein